MSLRHRIGLYVCLVGLLFGGCSLDIGGGQPPAGSGDKAHELGLPLGTPQPDPHLPGWKVVLSGERFVESSRVPGLTVSLARPGRVAGCALPTGSVHATAAPFLVVSDDGGSTWQAHPVAGAAALSSCMVIADAQQPDTFVVGPGIEGTGIQPISYITRDAGRTWARIEAPSRSTVGFIYGATTLVGGELLALLHDGDTHAWRFAERSPSGDWHFLDAGLPQAPGELTSAVPVAASLDAEDPSRIYAIVPTGPVGLALYATSDGGASWRKRLTLAAASFAALWSLRDHELFVQAPTDGAGGMVMLRSLDGGDTWSSVPLRDDPNAGQMMVLVGSSGRLLDVTNAGIFQLAAGSGQPSVKLADLPDRMFPAVVCVIVEGSQPALLCGDEAGTLAHSLPKEG
jgi:photosystem II stability/assembly factor-like uncharacterized protein